MSGSTIGGVLGAGIGFLVGGPAGLRWGFTIGSTLGGIISPEKIYGPKLTDATQQTAQEGVPIPWGYGTYPVAGHLIACSPATGHEREESGKGGPKQISEYYTRTYAIAFGEGEGTIVQIKRNGKLVYDITPTSTIRGKSAKFLRKHTLYTGSESQTTDPDLEAVFGADNTHPYRGTIYLVAADVECPNAAAVDTYEAVIQKCGTVTNLGDSRPFFLAGLEAADDSPATITRGGTWIDYTKTGVTFDHVACRFGRAVAISSDDEAYYSSDNGQTWTQASSFVTTDRNYKGVAKLPGRWVAVAVGTGADAGNTYTSVSTDHGDTWTETLQASIDLPTAMASGAGILVIVTDLAGSGIHTSSDGVTWANPSAVAQLFAVHHNGTEWLAVGQNGKAYSAPSSGSTWTQEAASTTGIAAFEQLCGQDGYFLAHASEPDGIHRSTDSGATWTAVGASASPPTCAASGDGYDILCDTNNAWLSDDGGLTFTDYAPPVDRVNDIAYIGPDPGWYDVPDGDGLYADEDGVLVDDLVNSNEASACGTTDGEIVADLCERAGLEAAEYDVTDLVDVLKGYRCATESSAAGFIEPLAAAFFFDRGEWDKKLRFVKRGGSSVAALTMDDLVALDGPPIEWEQVQEVDLLRKVNVMTLDPDADYSPTKQTWERRSSTITARGEATVEMPVVIDADTAAQIAEKRGKVAWDETRKGRFGLTVKWSKLTPTDIVTLTDRAGKAHTLRLQANNEESGVFMVEEAVLTRASTYISSAVGSTHEQVTPPTEGVVGPTLLALMNLAQLRNQDSTPGIYVGMAGILAGWPGAQLLMSVDGGLSYSPVLDVTIPTKMGPLTAGISSGGTPLSVRVFGGDLESKTTAQVATGANYAAVISSGVAEVLNYEDATATGAISWDLETLTRGLEGSTAATHVTGDMFVDLTTAYFVPIPQDYAGDTIYFKAVGLGLSADDIDAVSIVYAGWEIIYDGGGAA